MSAVMENTIRSIRCAHKMESVQVKDGCALKIAESDIGFCIVDGEILGYTYCGLPIPVAVNRTCCNHKFLALRASGTGSVYKAPHKLGKQGLDFRVLAEQRYVAARFQKLVNKMTAHQVLALLADQRREERP